MISTVAGWVSGNYILVYFWQKHAQKQHSKQIAGEIPIRNKIKYTKKRESTSVNK